MIRALFLISSFLLASCGGGGGGSSSNTNSPAPTTNNDPISLNAENASKLAEVYVFEIVDGIQTVEPIRQLFGFEEPQLNLPNQSETESCDGGGSVKAVVRSNGGQIIQDYNNCKLSAIDNVRIDGQIEINVSNIDLTNQTYTLAIDYSNFSIGESGAELTVDGLTTFHIDYKNFPILTVELESDRRVDDIAEGEFFVTNNFRSSLTYDAFLIFDITATGSSGEFNFNNEGEVSLSFADGKAELLGAEANPLRISITNGVLTYQFDEVSGEYLGLSTHLGLFISGDYLESDTAPEIFPISDITVLLSEAIDGHELDLSPHFFDANADLLRVSYEIFSSPENATARIEQESYFDTQFTTDAIGTYQIRVTISDPSGLSDTATLNIFVEPDTDLDGIADRLDLDDDNDGFLDDEDAFPLDPAEWLDTDLDGIGNNTDTDDDGDGVSDMEDISALDAFCSMASDTENGVCYSLLAAQYDKVVTDNNGVIYFLNSADKRIYRWEIASNSFLNSITLGEITNANANATDIMYSPAHGRLYVSYDNGAVGYFSPSNYSEEVLFTVIPDSASGLADSGNFVTIAQPNYGTHFIVDFEGSIVTSGEFNGYDSRAYAWSEEDSRMYYFRDGISPNDLHYREIDQRTGEVTDFGDTPYHGDYGMEPPILVSDELNMVIIGSGNVYSTDELTWIRAIPSEINAMHWNIAHGLLVARGSEQEGELVRYDASFRVVEEITMDIEPLALFAYEDAYTILSFDNEHISFSTFVPSEDTDADGIVNELDDFPLDPAASVDSDLDGYPDEWNSGYTEIDSTTGLSLDSVPNDSVCFLPEHSQNGECNYTAVVQALTPDAAISSSDEIFLLSKETNRIFRWSLSSGNFLPALVVEDPSLIAYSEAHNRIYLSYPNGEVTYIDLDGSDYSEQAFTVLPQEPHGLAAVGQYILLADSSGAWKTHYIYSESGELVDLEDWNYRSGAYAWNDSTSRVYFFRDDTSPNDLHYEEINQLTGEIAAQGESPYHGDFTYKSPLIISPNHELVLTG